MGHPEFEKVVKIVKQLRDPIKGCPWDKKQTHQSLTRYMIEEAYEFQAACSQNNTQEMEDELGDVLLQILLHCTIGEELQEFNLESVAKNLANKMIRRHPHVFGDSTAITEEEVKQNWEKIKEQEKQSKQMKTLNYLPALLAAHKIGEKTNRIGFDWKDAIEVVSVVKEELLEFLNELPNNSTKTSYDKLREEFGDLLFSIAQLGRHLNINSEEALQEANNKFIRRYNQMQELINKAGKDIDKMDQNEMDIYWQQVKQLYEKDKT